MTLSCGLTKLLMIMMMMEIKLFTKSFFVGCDVVVMECNRLGSFMFLLMPAKQHKIKLILFTAR